MDRLTVLGGGSPFTLGLVEAAADALTEPLELALFGRDAAVLELVRGYAAWRLEPLGWKVYASIDPLEALEGAQYVLHQIRYGGLEGRAEDELLASRFGAAADETLGPGALNSALRMAPDLRAIAGTIASAAPDAWVLNLTNPLSVATSILGEEGVERCVGLCELPSSTATLVARLLDLPPDRFRWDYRGLNHRGFLVGLDCDGEDQLPRLLAHLGDGDLGGVPAATMAHLAAVPTKYFALVQGSRRPTPGRAEQVRGLRNRIVEELRIAPHTLPPSLRSRQLPWYAESLVPALGSLRSAMPSRLVLNIRGEDGVTREMHAAVSSAGVSGESPPAVSPPVRDYLDRFERHERRVLEAVGDPSPHTIAAALAADPTLEPEAESGLAEHLWANHIRRTAVLSQ